MRKTIIITGAMGSGKTEIALELAERLAETEPVTLIDLDFVNPYYRSVDKRGELESTGIRLLAPEHTAIDTPLIADGTHEAITAPTGTTIVDLGGDPDGATIIAQFKEGINDYDFFAVINFSRITTENLPETIMLLKAIEQTGRLKLTGLISNTHMKEYTTKDIVLNGLEKCIDLGATLDLPVVLAAATEGIAQEIAGQTFSVPVLIIKRKLTNIWEI